MIYRFKVPIGDWSKDGHNQSEIYILEANHSVEEIRQAYKDSCKKTGISFNHNEDYTELNLDWQHPEYRDRHIATEYESSSISKLAEKILLENGINIWEEFDRDEGELFQFDVSENFLEILMKFIKISLPDLEYKLIEEELPYLNGYWNKELNVQFGYGLFE